ncbi:MAG: 2,3-dihydroxyphenylpropionate 1,2-dioxygenase [Microbacteriaceae bacterium]|jgi:2,3-dihydroxyphenylpropionate 1,2-dioxygenase|nr:2,3-dihydroxyphenylpropionate 1,2-dioxygenase [Microbacteriaceae bacterium]
MTVAVLAMSHSPLLEFTDPPPEVKESVEVAFDTARSFVSEYNPDVVVNFAPDHYNGFFYDIMPPFCIGFQADSVGDYGSQAGPLDVPADLARELAEFVLGKGIDLTISLRMEVDHGAVQPIELMFGDLAARPLIPVFVNSAAPPFCPVSRIRRLGEAVGQFFGNSDKRVLFIASGGLSHDPPIPQIATATAEQRALLLGGGRHLTGEARDARQKRIIDAARSFAAGTAEFQDLAPDWDETFLDIIERGELSTFDGWEPEWMTRIAGNSSHEVRTWIAAYSALAAHGDYEVTYRYYRPIREYIAGFAVTTAVSLG